MEKSRWVLDLSALGRLLENGHTQDKGSSSLWYMNLHTEKTKFLQMVHFEFLWPSCISLLLLLGCSECLCIYTTSFNWVLWIATLHTEALTFQAPEPVSARPVHKSIHVWVEVYRGHSTVSDHTVSALEHCNDHLMPVCSCVNSWPLKTRSLRQSATSLLPSGSSSFNKLLLAASLVKFTCADCGHLYPPSTKGECFVSNAM